MSNKSIGQIIKEIRVSNGVTATHMAKKLGYKAVSSYLRLENGDSTISLEKAKMIADILNVDVNDFFNQNLRVSSKNRTA
ncbi:MAG: helix-turn-helix domain-containing protein [Bacillota bacterium]